MSPVASPNDPLDSVQGLDEGSLADRDNGVLVDKPILLAFLVVLIVGSVTIGYRIANTPPAFIGVWRMEAEGVDLIYQFNSDRSGSITSAGEAVDFQWSKQGEFIVVAPVESGGESRIARTMAEWTVTKPEETERDVLTLEIGSEKLLFIRELEASENTSKDGVSNNQPASSIEQ